MLDIPQYIGMQIELFVFLHFDFTDFLFIQQQQRCIIIIIIIE